MRSAFVLLCATFGLGKARGCCSSDMDCIEMMSPADVEYLNQFGKTLECDQGCPGLINCNMFGLCEQCRGCFETCEGAAKYMAETSAPADFITFCSGVGISDLSECDGAMSGAGSGSGSASSGGSGSASGSGSGFDSAAGEVTASSASGAGSGSASMSSAVTGSASGSGMDSGAEEVTAGYASGAGSGSASMSSGGAGSASGAGSGSGTMSSSMATASGSGEASRVAEIEGCDCGTAELDPSFAAYFCENQKSMYCDLECVDDADPADFLFPSKGGLWCQPQGWIGCRMCKFDCSDYEGDCVPCPAGLKNWC